MSRIHRTTLALVALVAAAPPAQAQVVATLSWQTQPYCNVVTLTFVQQGSMYVVTGTDDGCGAGVSTVTGTAVPAGSDVAVGVSVNLPTGQAAHITASVRLSDASGTWTDADGNSGPLTFNGSAPGAVRPAPASTTAITVNQFAPSVYAGNGAATTVSRSDHEHDSRYYTKALADATFAANSRLLYAVVRSDGSLARGSLGATSAKVFTGNYYARFARDVSNCSFVASPGLSTNTGAQLDRAATVSGESGNVNGVFILTQNLASANADSGFHLIVLCP